MNLKKVCLFKMGIICLILFFLSSLLAQEQNEFYSKGIAAGKAGKFKEAEDWFRIALNQDPLYIPAKRGLDLIKDFFSGKIDQKSVDLLFSGLEFDLQGKQDESLKTYQEAVEHSPDYYYAHHNLGIAYYETEKTEGAIEEYKKAIFLNPDYPYTHNNLGLAYDKNKIYEEALEEYTKAITLWPDYFRAYYNMGIVYNRLEKEEEEIFCYFQALHIRPDYERPFEVLLERNYEIPWAINELISLYQKILGRDPEKIFAYDRLGKIFWKTGQWKEARKLRIEFMEIQKNLKGRSR